MKAFILIKVKPYEEEEFMSKIKKEFSQYLMKIGNSRPIAFSITGIYDIILGVDVTDEEKLKEMLDAIRKSKSTFETVTMIAL